MADPHVISALEDKAHQLRQAIVTNEERLERDRKELAVITAAITIFARDGGLYTEGRPAAIRNLFKRGEVLTICKTALAAYPEGMTTRDLGIACLAAREFDHEDPVLLRAMVGVLSNTLKKAVRRGEMVKGPSDPKPKWRLSKSGLSTECTNAPNHSKHDIDSIMVVERQ